MWIVNQLFTRRDDLARNNRGAAEAVYREANGLEADEIIEVEEGS
jgi:hypothetical protein